MSSVRPRVSVIIPCFNQACYLGEAIESALAQRGPSLEIVVVDDGSSDATRSVAERFREVRYIQQDNRGTAVARNRGLGSSGGEFIVFLDADDRLLPGAVEIGVRGLDEHPDCGFAYGFVNVIRPDGSLFSRPDQDAVDHEHYLRLLRHNYIWTPGAVLYRREAVESAGGFRSRAGGCADLDLNLRISRSWPVCCHGETVLEYRDHTSSQSSNSAAMLRSAVRVRRAQRDFVRGRREFEAALDDGIREDRAYYGTRLAGAIVAQLEARRWKEALAGLLTLLFYDPRRLIRHAVGRPA
jgi:glycosyltransferase involved in cell wall biosynthesis